MSKIRWGVLSTSKFAQAKIIPAILKCEHSQVTAIASRDVAKAKISADHFGIPKVYGSYEELLADKEVDVIYNPMPNYLHVPWSIKALEAGKHVLCEKPIGLNAADAHLLLDAAKKHSSLKIMEAFMYRHHPQWITAKKLVATGAIGQLRTIHSVFSYFNIDPDNIRNKPVLGGGGLMDIGCYNISLSRFIYGSEPKRVFGICEYDPQYQVDRIASGILDFGNGTSTFTCSTQLIPYQRAIIFGTDGRVEIEIPFNPPPDKPTRIWHETGEKCEEITFDVCDQYTIQADLLSRAIIEDTSVPTPLEDSVANMRAIDAVFESGRSGGWVYL